MDCPLYQHAVMMQLHGGMISLFLMLRWPWDLCEVLEKPPQGLGLQTLDGS